MHGSPSFALLHYVFNCKLWASAGENYWNDEFILYAGHHSRIARLPANKDAICWGKATIARKPSNEHDPYAVAVLENVGEEQQVALATPLHCKAQVLHL